jgi:two-component system, NarL family, response regulator NreC
MTIRLALVDDHQLFLQGLRSMIETQGDLSVVGEAFEATSACEMLARTRPDVAILDLALPGATGLMVAREALRQEPALRILVLSMLVDEERVAEALDAGVSGYASKTQPAEEIFAGIRTVAANGSYFSPLISRFVLTEYRRMAKGGAPGAGPLRALTNREREIFELTVRGVSVDTIAKQLFISKRTVETHRGRVMGKLNAHSAADLVRLAAKHGLLTLD